jgi:WD40 repeat protein
VIQYTVLANTNTSSRSGTITIYDGSSLAQQTLSISQAGAASGLASRSATESSPTTLSDSRTTTTAPDGSVFTAGSLSGSVYLGKATKDGEVLWMKWFEGTSGSVTALSLDNSGNVYVAGQLSGSIDFGGGALSSSNEANVFISTFSADGKFLWSNLFGDFATEDENSAAALNYLAQLTP